MARVTVEDCLHAVDNRFQLVLVAAKRARQLMLTGVDPHVDWENDKATVVALREVADGHVDSSILKQDVSQQAQEAVEAAEAEVEQALEGSTDRPSNEG